MRYVRVKTSGDQDLLAEDEEGICWRGSEQCRGRSECERGEHCRVGLGVSDVLCGDGVYAEA